MATLFNTSTQESFTTARNEFSSSNQSLPHHIPLPPPHMIQNRSSSSSPASSGHVNRFHQHQLQQRGQRPSPNYHVQSQQQPQQYNSRQVNPFGAIYGGTTVQPSTIRESARSSSEDIFGDPNVQHSTYFQIERNFHQGKMTPPNLKGTGPRRHTPPVVTIVDDSSLKRSGSIISREATLRNRNKIKSRNTTVEAKDLYTEDDDLTSTRRRKRDRLMFRFPVKRKTSLKYTKLPQQHHHPKVSSPDFQSNEQLQKFLKSCNAEDLVRELLPKRMQLFRYNQLVSIHPRLQSVHEIFDMSKDNEFGLLKINPKLISAPIQKHTQTSHSRHYSNIQFKEIVYQKYKSAVFANKLRRVPRFEEIYPDDLHLLKKQEIDQINQKLLFEVLLRRTVAAKIEYRLLQGGFDKYIDDETTSSRYSSENSSSNSRSGDGNTRTKQGQGNPGLEEDKESTNGSRESINTDELMQQNQSLFSELLPSPQISYTSDIFGSINFDSPKSGYNSNKTNSQDHKSIKTTTSTLDPYKIHSSNSPKLNKPISQESLYINNFNKSYHQKYNNIDDVESALFNSKVYQLKPINRSVTTLLSSDSLPYVHKLTTPPHNQEFQHKATDMSTKSSSSTKDPNTTTSSGKRPSNSTTNTSVFQNLEDLSSELSSFIHDDDNNTTNHKKKSAPAPPQTSTVLPKIITTLPDTSTTHSNLQMLSHMASNTREPQMQINPGPNVSNSKNAIQNTMSLYDIKSLKGSISVVSPSDYAQSNAPSISPTKADNELNTITENLQVPSSSQNVRSLSPNKLHSRSSNIMRRNDSNSTRSVMSSHKKDLSYSDSTDGSSTR
ncbi:hypothetical protein DFJ63DRAFT_312736 [Scheffersomyces coipomensis]|uniref:uncharacterized protein n=1 Tax=Scheffersomyces coipomensis TaxID=1788519 RepID=UPI00315C6606